MTSRHQPSALRDPMSDHLDYLLRRAALATLSPLTDAIGALGLHVTEAAAIRLIHANPGCNQAEIGRTLRVQRTNMVPIITALVTAGLVRREAADGRTNALFLTDKGRDLHARLVAVADAHEERFFGDMPADMKRTLADAARLILSRVPG